MFKIARLKLTGWYLLIIMSISLIFSAIIYQVLSNELERIERTRKLRIERRIGEGAYGPQMEKFFNLVPIADPELITEARRRILVILGITNLCILVVSGGLGFVLAGQTLAPIKEMVDEQNRFISDASHELRTPLTSLKSSMEVYLRDKQPKLTEAKKLIKESIADVDKLKAMSDALLQLTQIQKPDGNLKFERISVVDVANEAVRKVLPIARKRRITIENHTKEIYLKGETTSLVDLLVILLDNAIKYTAPGGKVSIASVKRDGNVLIEVNDTGIGINSNDLPHIFDRFYRSDQARSKNGTGGYGLGLSIAKRLAELHRGMILAKSEEGKGSTFIVKLPIKNS